jgi:hypothetical protein
MSGKVLRPRQGKQRPARRRGAASGRHLIEFGDRIVEAAMVGLVGADRAVIYGAPLWMADKLKSNQGAHACNSWAARGKQAF